MEYVKFGQTGMTVSRIGFGGAVAGLKNYLADYDPDTAESKKRICESLETALEKGITYFDTAPGYGDGRSETYFGEVLSGVKDIFVATKLSITDYDGARRSIEQSLKRLKRDSVDLLQIHGSSYKNEDVENICAKGGMLEAMEQFKKEGLIKYIGFTTEDNNRPLFDFMECGRFDMVQMCYNFLFQHGYEPSRPFGSLYEAKKNGLGVATMRAPTSGTFQRWMKMIRPDDDFNYTEALIQFVFSNPLVDVVLIGMRTKEYVIKNCELVDNKAGRINIEDVHTRYV